MRVIHADSRQNLLLPGGSHKIYDLALTAFQVEKEPVNSGPVILSAEARCAQ